MKHFSPDVSFKYFARERCEAQKYELKKGLNKPIGRIHQALNSYEVWCFEKSL